MSRNGKFLKLKLAYCRFVMYELIGILRTPYYGQVQGKSESEELAAALSNARVPIAEIAEFDSIRKNRINILLAQMISTFIYSAKNAIMFILMLMAFDHNNPARDLEPLEPLTSEGNRQFKFKCVATDCASFYNSSSESKSITMKPEETDVQSMFHELAEQFSEIPIVSLCYPTFSSIYPSARDSGDMGLIVFGVSTLGILLFCTAYPLTSLSCPHRSEMFPVIVTPNLARALMEERIRKKAIEFQISLANYKHSERQIRISSPGPLIRGIPHFRYNIDNMIDTEEPSRENFGYTEKLLADCMPSSRSLWWQNQLASLLISIHIMFAASVSVLWYMVQGVYMQNSIDERDRKLQEWAKSIESSNCTVWYHDDPTKTPIYLDKINTYWHPLSIAENFFFHFLTLKSVVHALAYFVGIYADLECMTLELKRFFAIVIESRKIKFEEVVEVTQSSEQQINHNICVTKLRQHFRAETSRLDIAFHKSRCAKLRTKLNDQSFVDSMLTSGRLDKRTQADMMEKLYISYRLLAEQLNHYNPTLVLVLISGQAANYTLVFLAVWLSKRLASFQIAPLVVVGFCWFIANGLVAIVSSFHAGARKLELLIWSLLATMELEPNNVRHNHLRLLWLKQAKQLASQGGLAIKMLGIRVTYVNILQMAIWTGTLLVFAIRPHG